MVDCRAIVLKFIPNKPNLVVAVFQNNGARVTAAPILEYQAPYFNIEVPVDKCQCNIRIIIGSNPYCLTKCFVDNFQL